jgi:ABC-type cobalamin/Fe3+-siderophores transport system ATPase subunit
MRHGALYASAPPAEAISVEMLRDVYEVEGSVEVTAGGSLHVQCHRPIANG